MSYKPFKSKSDKIDIQKQYTQGLNPYSKMPSYKNVLERIEDLRSKIRSSYHQDPSNSEIDIALTHAIAEINNLNKEIKRLKDSSHKNELDKIEITVGKQTIVIDDHLAAEVIANSVKEYLLKSLKETSDIKQPY